MLVIASLKKYDIIGCEKVVVFGMIGEFVNVSGYGIMLFV